MCPIFNVLNIMRHHLSRLVSLVNCNKKSKIDVRYPLPFFSYIIIIFVLGAVHKGHHHLKKIIKFLWNFFQILSQKRFFSNFIGKGCNLGNSESLLEEIFELRTFEDIGEEGVKKTGKTW